MKRITTIALDLAKQIFQVHGADADGFPVFNRRLRRAEVLRFFEKQPSCLVGIEPCGSSHYWAREIERVARYAMDSTSLCEAFREAEVRQMRLMPRQSASSDPQNDALRPGQID